MSKNDRGVRIKMSWWIKIEKLRIVGGEGRKTMNDDSGHESSFISPSSLIKYFQSLSKLDLAFLKLYLS